jgi:hypothetical protein
MMNSRLLLILFAFVGVLIAQLSGQCEDVRGLRSTPSPALVSVPQPQVDERVELIGIVFRLAEVKNIWYKEYDDAVNKHFAQYKMHPAVLAVRMFQYRIPHYNVAVHISIENGRIVLPDTDSEKTLEKLLEARWNLRAAQLFVQQLDDFYVKSQFHEFFEAHRDMYQKVGQRIKAINDKIDYSWFKKFFGDANLEHFHLVPTCTGDGGSGCFCRFKDGRVEYFAICTIDGPDDSIREEGITYIIVHEFSHYFCNPHVEKYIDELQPASERAFPFVSENTAYYYSGKTMAYEYLVRACTIRYHLHCGNKDEAERLIRRERKNGFFWIAELV